MKSTQFTGQYFKGLQHFFGVVEDRNDPLKMGRVKVRAYGVHTEDRSEIPTDALPWAMPIMPYTSASISGIGESPTGPVEGTWVFGFFADGAQMQQPMVMGTLIGAPEEYNQAGFNDPNKIYPKIDVRGETDVNRLARGSDINYSTVDSIRAGEKNLAFKKEMRILDVPVAGPPGTGTIPDAGEGEPSTIWDKEKWLPDEYLYRKSWNEPNPRYGGQTENVKAELNIHGVRNNGDVPVHGLESKYPLNHVKITESGNIREVDDSPLAERIHEYHMTGTFYEIQPNGTRVTKVVGDDYLMVMHDHNMHVSGNVNITVEGHDVRLLVKRKEGTASGPAATGGNMFIETDGDLKFNVRGNMHTKVGGTVFEEYGSDQATNVDGKKSLRVGDDRIELVKGNHREDISKDYLTTITGHRSTKIDKTDFSYVNLKYTRFVSDHIAISSTNKAISMSASANVNINTRNNFNVDATSKIDMDATGNVEITTPATVDVDGTSGVDINGGDINLNS